MDRSWATRPIVLGAGAFTATLVVSLFGWWNFLTITGEPLWQIPPLAFLNDIGGGLAFGISGFIIWHRRPGNVIGPLMVLIGMNLFMWSFEWVPFPPLVTLGQFTWGAATVLIGALVLLYPWGRIVSRLEAAWLVGATLTLILGVAYALALPLGKWECPDCRSWLTLTYNENVATDLWLMRENAFFALTGALSALLIRRWAAASPPMRRVMTPLWIAGFAFTVLALASAFLSTATFWGNYLSDVPSIGKFLRLRVPEEVWGALGNASFVSLFLIPLSLLWGQLRSRWDQAAVAGLAIELREAHGPSSLVDSLRRALGDASAELNLWSRPAQAYVTPDGLPVSLPDDDRRAVSRLDADDGPLAAIVHDPALASQRSLIDGVSAVAQMAIENERLQAEVKAQFEEVRASRQRIVRAADEERRRVERNIHDGAQQRLVSLSLALGLAHSKAASDAPEVAAALSEAEAELKAAISELRELARGIHPAILTEAGLGPALESLAEHSPIPATVEARLDGRLPPVVEATAYFVAAEGLTNVAKHASATAVRVTAIMADGWLRLSVEDDGAGGADLERGSGLRGLVDRVAALGGRLRLGAAEPRGTRLEADIPCA
jgi:signal transduction histidine kinase